ncbi:dihydroneopterin aldolase [Pantoea sp. Aalb]|uniref:dihydroneopterin aldolase n=1 Tax=Pantoea sp. Aalb TaxID=2576762 RepID=UPI0013276A66|nr:dihydroneopterin aldolase [Pantoea sp. Aalb]MXP67702.1 dihydroneopterin aldolase [Pantoea sp. Aalb]
MDILFIKQLTVFTTIGIYDWEKDIQQKLLFDIEIAYNSNSKIHYNVNNYLSYTDISNSIFHYLQDKKFSLIEHIAQEIAQLLMNQFKIDGIRIKVEKPGAIAQAKTVGVYIERGNFN